MKIDKNINLNDLYKLSMPVKLIIYVVIVLGVQIIGYFLVFSSQFSTLDGEKAKEAALKKQFQEEAAKASDLETLQKELQQIKVAFGALLKQLPSETEVPGLIQELHQAGANNGIVMDSLTPASPIDEGEIETIPYQVTMHGSYEQLSQFASDVGALSRIVTLDKLKITTDSGDSSKLILTATANTYRVLEPTEVNKSVPAGK